MPKSCGIDDQAIFKKEDQNFSSKAAVTKDINSNYKSNMFMLPSPIMPPESITPSMQTLQNTTSVLNYTSFSPNNSTPKHLNYSKNYKNFNNSFLSTTLGIQQSMMPSTPLPTLQPNFPPIQTYSNISLLPSAQPSAFSSNLSMFHSPSHSNFISTPFFPLNYLHQNTLSNFLDKQLGSYPANIFKPFMRS